MTSHDLRCPQCSAHVRPGADWCTLCFADLRLPEEQAAPAVPEQQHALEAVLADEPGSDAGQDPGQADGGRGRHARSAPAYDAVPRSDESAAQLEARADEMLAMLAAESPNPLGPLADRLSTTNSRVVAGLIGVVVISLFGWLVMTVLGHFL